MGGSPVERTPLPGDTHSGPTSFRKELTGVASRPLRLVLFGDGLWAANSLTRLCETGHVVVAVVRRTRPSSESLENTSRALGIPIFQPQKANTEDFVGAIKELGPDLNLSISYNQILRQALRESAHLGTVNFHAGKLPYYRGRNVINWAIINGETEIGLTAHYMDDCIDTGDIVLQRTLPIGWTATYGDVLCSVIDAFPDVVLETVDLIASGRARRVPQSHLMGTYYPGREEGDEWLDWSDTSVNLHNKIRAIARPGPGARTVLGDKGITIWKAFYDPSWPTFIATPGRVIGRTKDGVMVKTGDSTLLLKETQRDGEAPKVPDWPLGTRLSTNLFSYVQALRTRLDAIEQHLGRRQTL